MQFWSEEKGTGINPILKKKREKVPIGSREEDQTNIDPPVKKVTEDGLKRIQEGGGFQSASAKFWRDVRMLQKAEE